MNADGVFFFFIASINDLGDSTTKIAKMDIGCSN